MASEIKFAMATDGWNHTNGPRDLTIEQNNKITLYWSDDDLTTSKLVVLHTTTHISLKMLPSKLSLTKNGALTVTLYILSIVNEYTTK